MLLTELISDPITIWYLVFTKYQIVHLYFSVIYYSLVSYSEHLNINFKKDHCQIVIIEIH